MMFDIIKPALRRKPGGQFRKSLGIFNYKIGSKTHKKPGVIPF
jgi:hypothetical protein